MPGLKLPGRYRLGRHIATGGMASVWCAEDLVLGRSVAIKVISERFARDHVALARFEREARTAARVSGHPHVVTIYDVGEAERSGSGALPRTFIVMEHLTGGTVADALRVGEVRLQEALRWLREAASALDHAHLRGIVHRDIKPANFLLDGARVLHVADFGIARLGGEETITGSGELFGTAAYLSPEQALGRAASPASDRYALAVAAYELLVGQRPFNATHFTAQARQHVEQPPPAASERNRVLPPAVDEVLRRGLAKQPEARYATAAGFVDGLDAALTHGPGRAARRRPQTANGRPVRRAGSSPPPGFGARPAGAAAGQATDQPTAPPGDASAAGGDPSASGGAVPALRAATPAGGAAAARGRHGELEAGAPPPARGDGTRRRGRAIALAALVTAALGVGGLAAESQGGGHGGSSTGAAARTTRSASRQPGRRIRPRRPSPAAISAQTADALEAKGHQLMLDGAYSAAIPTLRQAVSVAPPHSVTYGYALFDLGRSLVLSGNPTAAVPILERRLQIPDQTQVVQQMLALALRASNGGTGVTSPQSTTTAGAATTSASTTSTTSGGPAPTRTTTTTIPAPARPPRPSQHRHAGPGAGESTTGSGGAGLPGPTDHAREHRRRHGRDRRREHGRRRVRGQTAKPAGPRRAASASLTASEASAASAA